MIEVRAPMSWPFRFREPHASGRSIRRACKARLRSVETSSTRERSQGSPDNTTTYFQAHEKQGAAHETAFAVRNRECHTHAHGRSDTAFR